MSRRHCDKKTTGRLSVQQRIVSNYIGLARHDTQVEMHATAPSKGHLSSSNTEAPIGTVVAGADETTLDGLRQGVVQHPGTGGIHLRYAVANGAVHGVVLRATEFSAGVAK